MNPEKPARLGEILIQAGIIDKLQLNTALKYQREWDRKLGEALVELGFISEPVLAKVLSKFLQVPHVELAQVKIHPLALQKVPKRLAEKYGLIPLDLQGEGPRALLIVAMIDPTNLVAIDEVAFTSGCKVRPVVATHSEIDHAIRRHYGDDRVVDVFFTSPNKQVSPPAGTDAAEPPNDNRPSEMVIMRQGVETKIPMHDLSSRSGLSANSPVAASRLDEFDERAVLRALIRLLIRKKIIDPEDLRGEVEEP